MLFPALTDPHEFSSHFRHRHRRGGGGVLRPRGVSLSNTIHSEVASCLPLPSLPVFCGAIDRDLRLVDVLAQAEKIAELLQHTDVSYLSWKSGC